MRSMRLVFLLAVTSLLYTVTGVAVASTIGGVRFHLESWASEPNNFIIVMPVAKGSQLVFNQVIDSMQSRREHEYSVYTAFGRNKKGARIVNSHNDTWDTGGVFTSVRVASSHQGRYGGYLLAYDVEFEDAGVRYGGQSCQYWPGAKFSEYPVMLDGVRGAQASCHFKVPRGMPGVIRIARVVHGNLEYLITYKAVGDGMRAGAWTRLIKSFGILRP